MTTDLLAIEWRFESPGNERLVVAAAWSDDIPTVREAPRSGLLLEQGKLRWNLNTPANIKGSDARHSSSFSDHTLY